MKRFLAKLFGITEQDIQPNETPVAIHEPVSTPEPEGGTIDVHGKINDNGQIELKIDWNDDFIKELRANGFNGANDDVIIQQYLATIHRKLLEEEKGGEFS